MIRQGVGSDLDTVASLEVECFAADAWSRHLVQQALRSGQVLVADHGEGYAVVRVVGDVADLDRIAVRPDRRGAGQGRALLTAAVDLACRAGAVRLLLEVADDNVAALRLYAAAGFVEISRRRGYYTGGVDAVVMELSALG